MAALVSRYSVLNRVRPTLSGTRSTTSSPQPAIIATFLGLLVISRTRPKPSAFRMFAPIRKSRSSSSNPSRWFASTVSNPWSCSA